MDRYSNREIDLLLKSVVEEIQLLKNRPFERDVRESLSRVESEIGQVKIYIEERVRQEREKSDKSYAPYLAWTLMLGIAGIIGTAVLMGVLKSVGL